MADDTHFRSYRQGDPRLRGRNPAAPAASGRQGGSDPLAELARLIGQTDPFTDVNRGGPSAAQRPAMPGAAADAIARRPGYHAEPPAAPAHESFGVPPSQRHFEQPPPFESQAPMDSRQSGFQPAYDPAIYGSSPQAGHFGSQPYYQDAAQMPQGEETDEFYDDEFAGTRPRRGLRTLLMLIGLALLGTGAAFGYRAFFGGGSAPPVIKAESTPSKVAPASKSEASNKLIYDRVGDPAQGEKVVSREEQPIDVDNAARSAPGGMVFPGLSAAADSGAASAPLGSMPPGPMIAEPKKIRTVTIRPDRPLAESIAPKTNAQPPARDSAPAPAAAPRSAAAPAPAAPSNAPLSLTPQAASVGPLPPPPTPAAPTRIAPAAAPTPAPATSVASAPASVAAGSYTVQVSSQRNEADAQASFHTLQAKFPELLGGRQSIIRRADLGDRGVYFRALVGPFASLDQATDFCGNLKAAGGQCIVQRN
ncbi:MAG: SPOR domain-containing protein [Xanthobacteraceae bacterium]